MLAWLLRSGLDSQKNDEDGYDGATRVIDAPQHALIVAIFSNLIEGLFIARGFLPPPTVGFKGFSWPRWHY